MVHDEMVKSNNLQFSSSHLLNHQINCMLDFAQVSSNRFEKEFSYFDVCQALVEQMELLDLQAKSMNIKAQINFEGFDDKDFTVNTDKSRLQQVFLNLYSNALKFTNEGTVTVTVIKSVDLRIKKNRIDISVQDTGIGISKEH